PSSGARRASLPFGPFTALSHDTCWRLCDTSARQRPPENGTRGRDIMRAVSLCAVSALALALASPALAQAPSAGNLEKLGNFQQTGTVEPPQIPQTGPKADAIKKNLTKIKMPKGFHIGLYALVPDARHIAVGPQGIVTFVGTRKSKV